MHEFYFMLLMSVVVTVVVLLVDFRFLMNYAVFTLPDTISHMVCT